MESATTTASNTASANVISTVERHEPGSNLSTNEGISPHTATTAPQLEPSSHSKHSPCTKTVEKLRSFKFVKTSKSKRPSDNIQSDLTPPPMKRRPVCDDVTNREQNSSEITTHSEKNTSGDCVEPTFKQPSFNPRAHCFGIAKSSAPSTTVSVGQSSRFISKVTDSPSTNRTTTLAQSCVSTPTCTPTPSSVATTPVRGLSHPKPHSNSPSLLRTPTSRITPRNSQHVTGSNLHTPVGTVTSSQSRLTTPQRSKYIMQTPTRGRQATPLICTPTGSGVTTPISRSAATPIKRKFPGPAGLLPSLVDCYT